MANAIFGNIEPGYLGGLGQYGEEGGGLSKFIGNVLTAALLVAGLASFAYLIIGGFRWLTSGGDPKTAGDAQKIITNAVVGLAIVVVAWLLTRIIETVFGVDILAPTFVGPG